MNVDPSGSRSGRKEIEVANGRVSLGLAVLLVGLGQVAVAGQEAGSSPSPAASGSAARLDAVLARHKDGWRPCQEAAGRLMENAVARSTASAEGRNQDVTKLVAESDQIKKDLAQRDCPKLKQRIATELKETGAADADVEAAWSAFVKSLKPEEKPAAAKE
jgi:hypothetical protein